MFKKLSLLAIGLGCSLQAYSAGMVTHLNMSKDAIDIHVTTPDLKHIVTNYREFAYTGTVYPDFDGSIGFLPWREARGAFGMTHGSGYHEAYFDYLRDTYDVKTCVARNDDACMKAVAMYLGIVGHSAQDTTWDDLFVRFGFIMDYQTDALWVGDLDTGGDVLMWDIGRGLGFSYTAPYDDLLAIYDRIGVEGITENYIGDGLRTHNFALEFENELFALQGQSGKYRDHAPWFMANAMSHPLGIPLYGKITAGVWEQRWQQLISEDGSGSDESPIIFQWPEDGAVHPADAYVTIVMGRTLRGATVRLTDEAGNEVAVGNRRGGNFAFTLFPREDLKVGQRYAITIEPNATYFEGGAVAFPNGYRSEFVVGESTKRFKTGNLHIDGHPSDRPTEQGGPAYFSIVDQRDNLCVEVQDGVVSQGGSKIIANHCDGSDKQKWFTLAVERDGHTRGTRLVSKLDNAYCLDLPGGNMTSGTQLSLAKCKKFENSMYWAINGDNFDGGADNTITSKLNNNMGLDVYGSNGAGTKIAISHIHGGPNQRFIRQYDNGAFQNERFSLKDLNAGKCLASSGQLATCDNSRGQQWWMETSGRIHSAENYLNCLHAAGDSQGANIEVRTCVRDNDNYQKWEIDGQDIRNRVNTRLVMDISGASTADGANINLWSPVWGERKHQRWVKVDVNGNDVNTPVQDRICFYENNDYTGREMCLAEGHYPELGNRWDDVISGVKFDRAGDLYVEAYEHPNYTGARYQIMENVAAMGAFKDRFSSIIIKRKPNKGYVCMYEDPDYRASGYCAFVGDQEASLHHVHFDDKFQSVKVVGNAEVVLYQHPNFGGTGYEINETVPLLHGGIDNQASSYQVREATPSGDRVCVYEHNYFTGQERCFGIGDHSWIGNELNDRVSSIKLEGNVSIEVFEHGNFGGGNFQIMDNAYNMGAFKDRISSLKVRFKGDDWGYACMYEDQYFRGTPICTYGGGQNGDLRPAHMNDKISSVRVHNGKTAVLYEHTWFNGGAYTVNRDEVDLGWIEDGATSYKVH